MTGCPPVHIRVISICDRLDICRKTNLDGVASVDDLEQLKRENAELRDALSHLRTELMQAQKLTSVGVLASSITHEFNNILTTVINYAKMGLRHKESATRDKAFDRILAAGQRAAKITTGMLSYARGKGQRDVFRCDSWPRTCWSWSRRTCRSIAFVSKRLMTTTRGPRSMRDRSSRCWSI